MALAVIAAAVATSQQSQAEIKAELLGSYDKTLRPSLWVATQGPSSDGSSCGTAPPEHVETQLVISKISIGLQQYEIEGYFRLWWEDARLNFTGKSEVRRRRGSLQRSVRALACLLLCDSRVPAPRAPAHAATPEQGGCFDKLVFREADDLWTPDIYYEKSIVNKLGQESDGDLVEVYPSGRVFWSRRARLTMQCPMIFKRMPFDRQCCNFLMGMWSQTAEEVEIKWRTSETGTAAWREQPAGSVWNTGTTLEGISGWERSLATWHITDMTQAELYETFEYNYTFVSATLQMERDTSKAMDDVWASVLFVMLSCTSPAPPLALLILPATPPRVRPRPPLNFPPPPTPPPPPPPLSLSRALQTAAFGSTPRRRPAVSRSASSPSSSRSTSCSPSVPACLPASRTMCGLSS